MTIKVLVTGGAGFVGSHTCKALAQAGYLPVTFDSLETGHDWAVKWGPLIRGDIRNRAALTNAIREHMPSAVLHFAGLIAVGESVIMPERYHDYNVEGTRNLVAAMSDTGLSRIIFSSSAAVYGTTTATPISEDHATNPENPYGRQKLAAERILSDPAHGLRSVSLRYFNAAGADPSGEIGEAHNPETHLIPLVLDAAMGAKPQIHVFGADYATPDGTCIRDFVHVSDLANAHVLALERLLTNGPPVSSDVFNLGTGSGASVQEVIAAAERVTGRAIHKRVSPRRQGDAPILVASCQRALSIMGWRPKHGDIETLVRHAWHWRQRQPAA